MTTKDPLYLGHFHAMVTEAVCCGLLLPIEWLRSYSRCIGQPYNKYEEIAEFVRLATDELFEMEHLRKPKDQEEATKWVEGNHTS